MTEREAAERADGGPARRHRLRNVLLVVAALVALLAGYLFVGPVGVTVPSATRPAANYGEAVTRVDAIVARETSDSSILPECHTQLFTHGTATDAVVVLFHGYTNCPKQYATLAPQLAAMGYNVLVPRMASHGEVPGTPGLFNSLTGEQVAAAADEAMDIADGLGARRLVFGLSGGGAVAAYVAQFRSDADRVVTAAPFLGVPAIPGWLTPATINALNLLPPIDQAEAPPDAAARGAYPHGASDTSTHGAASYMRVGQTVLNAASDRAPAARDVVVVVNLADDIVNNAMAEDLGARWIRLAPDRASVYRFDASLGILHDMITPDRAGAKTDTVYPVIVGLLTSP